jgi:hypothetical protein
MVCRRDSEFLEEKPDETVRSEAQINFPWRPEAKPVLVPVGSPPSRALFKVFPGPTGNWTEWQKKHYAIYLRTRWKKMPLLNVFSIWMAGYRPGLN